jgi:competence protein ComEA
LIGSGINFLSKKYSTIKTIACFNRDFGKIDLNKADLETLIGIAGIGEKLARRIIEYRKENGNFQSPEDLRRIKGINNYRYEKIKDLIYVR